MSSSLTKFDWSIGGHVITLAVLTLFMCALSFYYSKSIKKAKDYKTVPRLTLLIFIAVQWIRRNTYQIIGKSYKSAVPFFIYIVSLFWFSNLIAILGFDSLGNSLVIPATLAVVVFFGTIVSGIVHRGIRFFGDYVFWIKWKQKKIFPILDPLKFVGEASKILSLAFRLWGNTLAGSLILFVIYKSTENLFNHASIDYLGPVLLPLFVFPFHIYFDIIDGTIQPLIFMLLTMCYWAMARHGESGGEKNLGVKPEER